MADTNHFRRGRRLWCYRSGNFELLFAGLCANQKRAIPRCFDHPNCGKPCGPKSVLESERVNRGFFMNSIRWYAFTTQPRHEKVVARQLESKSIESFLPLLTTASRRKDRHAVVDQPLFPGYVFTRIDSKDRTHVLKIPSVVRMLAFNGAPAAIEDPGNYGCGLGLLRRPQPDYLAISK